MTDFPADLPDLLRLACGQGKMRLNVFHGADRGHQANLANAADGWTVEHDRDPLEAIIRVLRIRFGKMLERRRAAESIEGSVHPAHLDETRHAFTDPTGEDDCETFNDRDILDAIAFVLARRGMPDDDARSIGEAVVDYLYGAERPPADGFHADAVSVDDDFAGLL